MEAKKSIREVAVQILLAAKRPLHISEITERVLAKTAIASKTPEKTINNALQKDHRVVRVGRGTFQAAAPRQGASSAKSTNIGPVSK